MSLTFFSVLMAFLFSTAFIILVHLLRKNKFFLRSFGIASILFLYVACFARMVIAIEFPFAKVVGVRRAYSIAYQAVALDHFTVGEFQTNWLTVLCCIWIFSALFALTRFLWRHCRKVHILGKFAGNRHPTAEKILEAVKEEAEHQVQVGVCVCPGIAVPFAVGLVHARKGSDPSW